MLRPPCVHDLQEVTDPASVQSSRDQPPTTLHRFTNHGIPLEILDYEGSYAAGAVAHELDMDDYGLRRISFAPGDVVVDVGGHIGFFSIYLSLCHPGLVIHAFEPFPDNYRLFQRNLELHPAARVHFIGKRSQAMAASSKWPRIQVRRLDGPCSRADISEDRRHSVLYPRRCLRRAGPLDVQAAETGLRGV